MGKKTRQNQANILAEKDRWIATLSDNLQDKRKEVADKDAMIASLTKDDKDAEIIKLTTENEDLKEKLAGITKAATELLAERKRLMIKAGELPSDPPDNETRIEYSSIDENGT